MFTKIVVPLDGSPLAEQAIGQAAAIARASGASIDVMLVHQPFPQHGFTEGPWDGVTWDVAHRYIESIATELAAGANVQVTHHISKGEPVEMICHRAADLDADLIVMTSHGRTGIDRAWFGSVADGVMRRSSTPVLLLRPVAGKPREMAARRPFSHVLLLHDGTDLSSSALPAAAALAQSAGAKITLLRVVQPIPQVSLESGIPYAYLAMIADEPATQRYARDARDHLEAIARRLEAESGCEVRARVVVDPSVAPTILAFANAESADVIAIGTHGGTVSRFFLGSIADKVLRGSELPVLLYHPVRAESPVRDVETPDVAHA